MAIILIRVLKVIDPSALPSGFVSVPDEETLTAALASATSAPLAFAPAKKMTSTFCAPRRTVEVNVVV